MRPKDGAGGRVSFIQAARRRQIIAAAIETAVGYGQASLARIAEHADISKSVISYHSRAPLSVVGERQYRRQTTP